MEQDKLKVFLSELSDDADSAAWNVGYMRAIMDETLVGKKLQGSFSGYVMAVANDAVKRALALYCARAWDDCNDAISLRAATKNFSLQEILLQSGFSGDCYEFRRSIIERRYESFVKNYNLMADNSDQLPVRVFRTEWLAHRVISSRDRTKIEGEESITDITLNSLVKHAEKTIELVGELVFVCTGTVNPYPERFARVERYCREFWRLLPVLKDVEKENIS